MSRLYECKTHETCQLTMIFNTSSQQEHIDLQPAPDTRAVSPCSAFFPSATALKPGTSLAWLDPLDPPQVAQYS